MTPERMQRLVEVLDRRQPDLTLVTDYVHKGRNLSAVIRTADAAGVLEVHAVVGNGDYRAFRGTASGSQGWVRVRRHPDIASALAGLKGSGHQIVVTHLGDSSRDYREVDYCRPTALVLGAEKRGVSAAALAAADCLVQIPMVGMVRSLNVSVAAGILLAEAQRQRQLAGLYARRRIDQTTWDHCFFSWAHPRLRAFCEHYRIPFPALGDDGEVIDLPGWYAGVREDLRARGIEPNFLLS